MALPPYVITGDLVNLAFNDQDQADGGVKSGQIIADLEPILKTNDCGNNYNGPNCFKTDSTSFTSLYIVKLEVESTGFDDDDQLMSFKYSTSGDPFIRLGDFVGFVNVDANNNFQYLMSYKDAFPIPRQTSTRVNGVVLSNYSWNTNTEEDRFRVWVMTDATSYGYFVSSCQGETNPSCNNNPTCGTPANLTNVPVYYQKAYNLQNYGEMTDETVGGNQYSQAILNDQDPGKRLITTSDDVTSASFGAPSEHIEIPDTVTFFYCNQTTVSENPVSPGTCENFFQRYEINPRPLPSSSDPVDRRGLDLWVYLVIIFVLILVSVVFFFIYIKT